MAAGKAKNKKGYAPHFKYNYRKKDKDEALFDLRLTNENLRKENERLLNSLYELDKKNINQLLEIANLNTLVNSKHNLCIPPLLRRKHRNKSVS